MFTIRQLPRDVVVVSAVRTAIGDRGGSLASVAPSDLAGLVATAAIERSGLQPNDIGHSVFGHVINTEGRDHYLSRVAARGAGIPDTTPAMNVNRLCGSGLQAIISAAQSIALGDTDAAVAGGAESMSRAPYWLPEARWGLRMGDGRLIDVMVAALTDPFSHCHMGITAENIAQKWGISRAEQDALAVQSHQRAAAAMAAGYFTEQIVPVIVPGRRGTETIVTTDEHVRPEVTLDEVAALQPAFDREGTVTAANASGINDAAAAVVLMDNESATRRGITPLGRLVAYRQVGVDPDYMGIGPVPAVQSLLQATGLGVEDIDLFEVNEAFAAQALAVIRDLTLPPERTNPNGSGISLGHPIGATGTILVVKALHELARTGGRYAIVTMCIGGGQGIATLLERA